jgi:hypothetical protein
MNLFVGASEATFLDRVTVSPSEMSPGTDYTMSTFDSSTAGARNITFTSMPGGNYTGSHTVVVTFANAAGPSLGYNQPYTRASQRVAVEGAINWGSFSSVDFDFDLSTLDFENAGTRSILLTHSSRECIEALGAGTTTLSYTISRITLASLSLPATVTITAGTSEETFRAQVMGTTGLEWNIDYTNSA